MSTPLPTSATARLAGRFALVVARGEFDIATVPQLQEALRAAVQMRRHVRVDLAEVEFFDVRAVAALDQAEVAVGRHGFTLQIDQPSPVVTRVLELARRPG